MSNPERKARWLRRPGWLLAFGVFMVVFVALLIAAVRWNQQQVLIAEIQSLGGQVETAPVGPAWLRKALGDDHMRGWDRIVGINLADRDVNDGWLPRILHLRDLEWIDLTATNVSMRGLARIAELPGLKQLYIEETAVSDEALAELDAAHPDVTLIRGRRAPIATALAMRHINRHALTCAVFSPDDRWIACGDGDGNLIMLNRMTGRWRSRPWLSAHEDWLFDAAFSPVPNSFGNHELVTVGGDNAVCVWDTMDDTPIARLTPHAGDVHAVVISPDGNSIVTAGDDGTICVTDRLTGELTRWTAHEEAITSLALSPDGLTLVSGSRDDTVKLWDPNTHQQTACLSGHLDDVHAVAFSPNGANVASASYDRTVALHRSTGEFVREFAGHTDWIFTIAFSPDGSMLASGSGDGTIRLWDTETGQCRQILQRQRTVSQVSFSHDGLCLASAAADGNLCLWNPADGNLLAVIGTPFRAHP